MDDFGLIYTRINEKKPLVHHITNWVTIYDCANMTRAFNALPVMAHAPQEVEQMVGLASSLVLNIGTLTVELVDTMALAAKAANKKGIPVVLDAVGVGATDMRTKKALQLIDAVKIDILKGNYGEIGVLAGAKAEVKGVESMGVEGDPVEIAKNLSEKLGNTVVMTGKTDIISSSDSWYKVDNGCDLMGAVVGTGCMASSVIGCFSAVENDYALACAAALASYGFAAEKAAVKSAGPGTFKEQFYDSVYSLTSDEINGGAKVTVL